MDKRYLSGRAGQHIVALQLPEAIPGGLRHGSDNGIALFAVSIRGHSALWQQTAFQNTHRVVGFIENAVSISS